MAKKLIGFPFKYKCSKCSSEFTWDKDRVAHQKKCKG
jgi:DNA-directed RNA polymerase subunit RPC12/RpoP